MVFQVRGRSFQVLPTSVSGPWNLTKKGKDTHQRAHSFHHQKFEKLLSGLTPEERETLVSLLEQAINAAENEPQGEKNV